MSRRAEGILIFLLLTCTFVLTGCFGTSGDVIDAPPEVFEIAQDALTEKNITDEITGLTLEEQVDITYEAFSAIDKGVPTGKDVSLDIYSIKYDDNEAKFVIYNCDGQYTPLINSIFLVEEITSSWKENVIKNIFDVEPINYEFWKIIDEYSFVEDGKLTSLGQPNVSSPTTAGLYYEKEKFPMFNSNAYFDPISFMATDIANGPRTYRGICVGTDVHTLLRIYPKDLALFEEIPANRAGTCDEAYVYMPEDGTNRDIIFFVKDGLINYIEMGLGVVSSRYEKPYVRENYQPSKFKADLIMEFVGEEEIAYENATRVYSANIRIPQIKEEVIGSQIINQNSYIEEYFDLAEKLQSNNFVPMIEKGLTHLKINYHIYRYENLAAFIIERKEEKNTGDKGNYNIIWYYNCDKGQIISAREYAELCGVKEKQIIKEYNEERKQKTVSIYEVPFYVDFSGREVILTD